MKIYPEALGAHLTPLRPIYLLSGNEPLLIDEAREAIFKAASNQGISHRETLTMTTTFNWQELTFQAANFSLFDEQKILELRFTQKINAQMSEGLCTFLEKKTNADIILITTEKLDATAQKSAWFNLIDRNGIFVAIWPPKPQQFAAWIEQRLKKACLQADRETIALLCERTQGNLLAANQEIEKLALTFTQANPKGLQKITFHDLAGHGKEQGHYDVFAFIDSILARQPNQASKILNYLKETGVEAVIVLWALARELRLLISVSEAMSLQGLPMTQALQKMGVWENRQVFLQNYIKQSKLTTLYDALQKCAAIDRIIKGLEKGHAWQALLSLSLELSV